MKILWVINAPIEGLSELANRSKKLGGGTWLKAALDSFYGDSSLDLAVATVYNTDSIKKKVDSNITYYLLPGGLSVNYKINSKSNISAWKYVENDFSPDIINIWGTEFPHSYLALKIMKNIPSIVYMQGMMEAISSFYYSSLTFKELYCTLSFKDIIKRKTIFSKKKITEKRAYIESKILKKAGSVIVENDWCENHCKVINPNLKIFKSKLPINDLFFNYRWNLKNINIKTIFCNSASYPLKGLHILLRAFRIVVDSYPDAQLRIPGALISYKNKSKLKQKLLADGYSKLINKLIDDFDLRDNILFLGVLSTEEMAVEMTKANVFVLSSCLENHSSTLIEAMCVGVPCICSSVGGIPEYAHHEQNALLYRYEEYIILANYIKRILDNSSLALKLSKSASNMRINRQNLKIKKDLLFAYNSIYNS